MPCDNNTPDAGLAADSCVSIDDGPAGQPWLSPDIKLTDPAGNDGQAVFGGANTVDVRVHRGNCAPGSSNIIVEVWVGNPSLVMSPGVNTRQIGTKIMQVSQLPMNSAKWLSSLTPSRIITWTPPTAGAPNPLPADDPEHTGHKCLIARAYPDNLAPDPGCFHIWGDSHVAQRNIEIVAASKSGGGNFRFQVSTLNAVEDGLVRVLAHADLAPSRWVRKLVDRELEVIRDHARLQVEDPEFIHGHIRPDLAHLEVVRELTQPGVARPEIVREIVQPHLMQPEIMRELVQPQLVHPQFAEPDFGRVVTMPQGSRIADFAAFARVAPKGFQLEFDEVSPIRVRDNVLGQNGRFGRFANPNFEAVVPLRSDRATTFNFSVDLATYNVGDAHIFHLTQVGEQNRLQGGLTLVVVPVE